LLALALLFTTMLFVAPGAPQELARKPRIGVLMPSTAWQQDAFRDELRALGYIEGRSISIEWRQTERVADLQESRALVAELIRANVDLIVTAGTPASKAAMDASNSVPVVFAPVGDPVSSGLADSLGRPGKNGTGVSVVSTEMYPKRLEILHALAPRARRIGYLGNSSNPSGEQLFAEATAAASRMGLQLHRLDARHSDEIDAALRVMQTSKVDAVMIGGDLVFVTALDRIANAVRSARLPAVFPWKEFHRHGVLMSYGPSMNEVGRAAAKYVDKILKGAHPSELPIEQISKYYLVIDLRVARQTGIDVPQNLLFRADEVIR